MVLHAFFAWHQPFTNDEGAYLYDARILLEGRLPAGDVLTKALLPVALFAAGELLTGKSLFAARIINSMASIATVLPLFFLLTLLTNTRVASIGAGMWLLGSGTIVFNTMGHTQAIANLFAVTCLWLFVRGCRVKPGMTTHLFLAGMCFALAYASRKTAIAVTIPMIISWLVFRHTGQELWKTAQVFLYGVLGICIPWAVGVYILYGTAGLWHMAGAGYADIVVHAQSVAPWAGSAERMFAEAHRIGFVYGLLLVAICMTIMRSQVLVGASWIAALAILYWLWPTHLVEYLADFILPIVIAGSLAVASLRLRIWQQYVLVIIFIFTTIASLHSVYIRPWTGMFTRDAVAASAQWLQNNVPADQEIFTAAVIIPYLSGHHVPFDLSHPQWYGYDFISQQDKNVFLPLYSQLQKTVATETTWMLRDQLTDYVYQDISPSDFQEVHIIPNTTIYRDNLLRIYKKMQEEI